MGATPLEELVMGTRSGSVDPGLLLTLVDAYGLSVKEVRQGLERHSGLLGLSDGRSSDTRELIPAAADGDADARLALEVFAFRARQGIAEAAVCLDRLDAVIFTGEIGADQPEVRRAICAGLAALGVDSALEPVVDGDAVVSGADTRVPVVVPTVGEDLQVAAETRRLLVGA
jgi:acetate kinase